MIFQQNAKIKEESKMAWGNKNEMDLIVTIVEQGRAEDVIDFAKAAGAEGGTILSGRGCGSHDTAKLLGILIEPEKEVVLTLVPSSKTSTILTAIEIGMDLNKPGKGIAFVINVSTVVGLGVSKKEEK